MINNKARS